MDPADSVTRFGDTDTVASPRPARAEQRAKFCWSRRQNATPNTTRRPDDPTTRRRCAVSRHSRFPRARHLEGGKPGRCLAPLVSCELTLNSDVLTCARHRGRSTCYYTVVTCGDRLPHSSFRFPTVHEEKHEEIIGLFVSARA